MTIVADVRGTGPRAIVVLSGWFGRDSLYDSMLAGFDLDEFTLALVDYRGYGTRKDVQGACNLAEICGDVVAGVDELGWSSFGLLAHSMAGPAAVLVASALPGRITGYLGISPVPPSGVPFDEQTRAFFASATDSTEARAQIIDLSTGHRCPPAWVNGLAGRSAAEARPEAFAKYFYAWADANVEEEFRSLDIPIRVIVGENDLALTRDLIDATFVKLQPSTKVETFANCGHYAMVEAPLALAADIQEFFGAGAVTADPAGEAGH